MLENCATAKERWGGVSNLIDRWLQERQNMLVCYCQLGEIRSFDSSSAEHQEKVKHFCQLLVDYVSAGHFEIYDQLIREGKDFGDEDALKTASELFSCIDETTEKALDFNDKYLETDDLDSFGSDIDHLGQALASRFEAEDKMIEVLHYSHQNEIDG